MKVRYGITTVNQFDWVVDKHIPSVDESQVDAIHLHLNNSLGLEYHGVQQSWWDVLTTLNPSKSLIITDFPANHGLARSWNLLCRNAFDSDCDAIIIARDWLILDQPTITETIKALGNQRFVHYSAANYRPLSFFALTRELYQEIGEFDTQFWPEGFEDSDYLYRMKLMGIPLHVFNGVSFFSGDYAPSDKYDNVEQAIYHHNFRKNAEYYVQKWGGLPGYETYRTPLSR